MKKSYLMIAAAALVFAACSNEKPFNEAPVEKSEVIGFTSYSENPTKAGTVYDLEYYHNTFAVYGTKKSSVDSSVQYVFGGKATAAGNQSGVTCTFQTTADSLLGDWKYVDPRYWDKQSTYNFIAYAPASATICYYYSAADAEVGATGNTFKTSSDVILTGTNLQATATEAEKVQGFNGSGDIDIMTSDKVTENGTGHSAYVNLLFKHILSKLNVTVSKAASLDSATVTVKSVEITGLNAKGSYNESTYNDTIPTSGWTASPSSTAYKLSYSSTEGQALNASTANKPFFFIESLVMPQTVADAAKVVVKYTIKSGSHEEDFAYKMDLKDAVTSFLDRNKYNLKFTIGADVIKFDASVDDWTNNDLTGIDINK